MQASFDSREVWEKIEWADAGRRRVAARRVARHRMAEGTP